jgi:hypothetical protein
MISSSVDLLTQLSTLVTEFHALATAAARKLETQRIPVQGAYYAGCMFGFEEAADKLAVLLAQAMREQTQLNG